MAVSSWDAIRAAVLASPFGALLRRVVRSVRRRRFRSGDYWERRYAAGGNSGPGSYSQLAEFKAQVINAFVADSDIRSVIEFGCGDGHQLGMYSFDRYCGLDVSPTAISMCRSRFAADTSKSFMVYTQDVVSRLPQADAALSIDVLYHIVEDKIFHAYLRDLFAAARRFVVIYSTDFDKEHATVHQRDRAISPIIAARYPEFALVRKIANPLKGPDSMSDFFIYARRPDRR